MRVPIQINSMNKTLLGVFHIPNTQCKRIKVIIMCYGLNGNRVEQHRMCVKFGEVCEKNNINLVRFDYTDVGVSEGDFGYSTLSNRVTNVIDVVDYVRGCFNQEIDIYLVGFSDGAKIAANSFLELKCCKGIILWNPIINIGTGQIKNENRMNNRLKIDRSTKKPYKPLFGLKLNLQMIRELMKDKSMELMKCSYKKLFVFGEKDAFTSEIRKYFITHRE